MYNKHDLEIWDDLFSRVPDEWKTAAPSLAMRTCSTWLGEAGSRDVLDIGCGMGRWSVWLARQGFRLWGADFSPRGVAYASKWAKESGLQIPVACTSITARAFPDRRFDAVVAALVFDLVSTPEFTDALEVVRDSLRPLGHLFAVFNPPDPQREGKDNPTSGLTRVLYSDAEIKEIVGEKGFSLVKSSVLDEGTRGFMWRLDEVQSHGSAV